MQFALNKFSFKNLLRNHFNPVWYPAKSVYIRYEIQFCNFFCRYMIAARDIEPLELILKEEPAVVGPYSKSGSGCLQCLKKVDGSYLCSGCQFPMCNSDCELSPLHRDECHFFQGKF